MEAFHTVLDNLLRHIFSTSTFHQRRRDVQLKTLQNALADHFSATERSCIRAECEDGEPTRRMIDSEDKMGTLVEDILNDDRPSPLILGITRKDSDNENRKNEVYLNLAIPSTEKDDNGTNESFEDIVLVPIMSFCEILATAFEQHLISTAFCFVADASSGLGTEVLEQIATTCGAGVALVKEPSWMTNLAYLTEQKFVSKLDRIVFALCRLELWRVRKQTSKIQTVVITLPGQSCTVNILPSLQNAFPCERHVFVYDGCVDSTSRACRLRKQPIIKDETELPSHSLPTPTPSMSRSITATIPISPLNKSLIDGEEYTKTLGLSSAHYASSVESWMSSVDTFLTLKENERETGYLPFVCRLGFLFADTGRLGNGSVDVSDLALTNVLQHITGSRSRPLESGVFDKAKEALMKCRKAEKELMEKFSKKITAHERTSIEACVFVHKGILIGDKTLLDTVQPKKDWSLKAAKKMTACACCAPEEGEEDEDSEIGLENTVVNKPKSRPKYVDGKTTFAFDPTKFTMMQ